MTLADLPARNHLDGAIDAVLQDAVATGGVPHIAAIVADRDGVVYEGAAGPRAVGEDDPLTTGTRFRLMSMTKMVATAVALQQVEQGALELDAPVDTYCPQFADLQVLEGFDGDTPRLRAPASRATVRQLMSHTAGLGYWFWNPDLVRWHEVSGVPNVVAGLASTFTTPLVADPGTRFDYGISTDWLGKVVEAVTGVGLDVAVKESITGPLGMDRTTWQLEGEGLPDCTPVHVRGEDGTWTAIGEVLNQAPEWWAGGHGLYAPPTDYIRFQRALLRGGELDGVRILEQASVDAAFSNQIGELDVPSLTPTADPGSSDDWRPGPGWKFGLGLLVNTDDRQGMRRAGSGAWAGLCNTQFWIDRTAGVCGSVYSNFLPFLTPAAVKAYEDVEKAVYAGR